MKTNKNLGKHSKSPKSRVDDDFLANKGSKKDRSGKRRLSIYDDFDDDIEPKGDSMDFDSADNPFDD